VSVKADGAAWTGASYTEAHSVPIWVEVQNRSDVAVRVGHSDWALVEEGASAALAINPRPGLAFSRYRSTTNGRGPRVIDPEQTGFWWQAGRQGVLSPIGRRAVMTGQPVHTWDMVRLALREGELQPGETAAGFVYFPRAILRARRLALTWLVHDAQGRALGGVGADFRVRRGSAPGYGLLSIDGDAEGGGFSPEWVVTPTPLPRPGDPIVPP
jgi:hypothetical protein